MELRGKYNSAKVFTDNIDDKTISQVINLCNQPMFKDSDIRIMPDCHAGKGCVIGTTMTIKDKVVPNLVGVDIGCGMATIALDLVGIVDIDLDKIDTIIRENIPHGIKIHARSREKILKDRFKFNLNLENLYCKDKVSLDRAFKSAGSLGGGNHFIEINKTEEDRLYLTVHTGSRNLGKQIAEYYQREAIKYCKDKYRKDEQDEKIKEGIVKDLKEKGQEHLIRETLKSHTENNRRPHDDLCYLEGVLMKQYLHDMDIAQKFAEANRILIITDIIYHYKNKEIKFENLLGRVRNVVIECIHNFIDINDMVLRKGAISAKKDELVIIPVNMRDGIILGLGKGNKDWNNSAPHGAGRISSRRKAKEQISMDDFKESMKEVYTTCVKQSTLDEAPQAYKPMEEIIDNIGDTVDIAEVMKPIYNFKSN
jgi:tRNA-splicing ligase RtcB